MKTLTRDDILNISDIKIESIDIPEWGGKVYVRTMSGKERDALEAGLSNLPEATRMINARAKYAALSVCDKGGKLLFTSADLGKLGAKCASALDKIFEYCLKHNKITEKDFEDTVKNLESGQS